MTKEKIFISIYSIILIAELLFTSFESLNSIHYITKPLLMISLIIYFSGFKIYNQSIKIFVLGALFFSLAGDILLMFVKQKSTLFIYGLIAFLFAHIMYIIAFSKERNKKTNPVIPLFAFIAYGIIIFFFLKEHLGGLLIPVAIYMMVILLMALLSFLRKGKAEKSNFLTVFTGALLFVLSDTLLAINKFHTPIPYSNFWIMITYASAQLLIVLGIIRTKLIHL